MAESFITQCPHCGTSFRVSNEQLAVANGSVRCGACLQVFSARNHVVSNVNELQKKVAKPKAPPAKQKVPPASKTKPALTRKPAVQPNPMPKPPTEPTFSFQSDDDDEFIFTDGPDDDDFIFDDGPNDTLFDEEEQNDGLGELSESFMSLNDSSKTQKTPNHFQKEAIEMESEFIPDDTTDDESWAESILEEIEKEEKSKTNPAAFAPSTNKVHAQPVKQAKTSQTDEFHFDEFSNRESMASRVVNNASQDIELDFNTEDRLHKLRPLGWLFIVLLCFVFIAQLAWAVRGTYARMDQWRGLYQQACNIIGCTLPEQVDLDSIRTSVIVREHKDPLLKDIRMVDVVLTNKAPFKQPFPNLVMQYTDVNGKLIADMKITPDQYLKGELTGVELMPINTRVYISFPIQKPSASAVNYQLILDPQVN